MKIMVAPFLKTFTQKWLKKIRRIIDLTPINTHVFHSTVHLTLSSCVLFSEFLLTRWYEVEARLRCCSYHIYMTTLQNVFRKIRSSLGEAGQNQMEEVFGFCQTDNPRFSCIMYCYRYRQLTRKNLEVSEFNSLQKSTKRKSLGIRTQIFHNNSCLLELRV